MTFSSSPEEHNIYVKCLPDFRNMVLLYRYQKCKFGVNEIQFLGHRVTQHCVFPLPAKVDAIQSFAD